MMTVNELDPRLQELFAASKAELPEEEFTGRVIDRSRRLRRRVLAGLSAALVLLLALGSLLSVPLLEFGYFVSRILTATLFDLGEGWVALILMPLNNVASLAVLGGKLLRTVWRRGVRGD